MPAVELSLIEPGGGGSSMSLDTNSSDTASDKRKLLLAIFVSTLFFFVELVGGVVAGSLALLSDSFHLLSDVKTERSFRRN